MDSHRKYLLRTAAAIQTLLQGQPQPRWIDAEAQVAIVCDRLHSLTRLRRQLTLCRQRGWNLAAALLFNELHDVLENLSRAATPDFRMPAERTEPTPGLRLLYEELVQAEEEFDDVEYRGAEGLLVATTAPITLEDVALGRFELQLRLNRLRSPNYSDAVRIVALEPNPASGHSEVTHPHVSHERLCAGEATIPLQNALHRGRLCDALLLIRAVLENYNSHSPYAALDRWDGIACYDCGNITNSEDTFYCESCNEDYCGECIDHCRNCEDSRCRGCLIECFHCEDYVCLKCRVTCPDCAESFCPECLRDGLCPNCQDKENSDDDRSEEQSIPVGAAAAGEKPSLDTCPFVSAG